MAEDTTGGIGQADDIQEQINQALQELDQISNTRQVITDPDGLEACERAILKATDKLARMGVSFSGISQSPPRPGRDRAR